MNYYKGYINMRALPGDLSLDDMILEPDYWKTRGLFLTLCSTIEMPVRRAIKEDIDASFI